MVPTATRVVPHAGRGVSPGGVCMGALQGPQGPGRCLQLGREKEEY